MPECPRCGNRMSYNDRTTKLVEYVCPRCHETQIDWTERARRPSGTA
ncbi:hypothetical protein [Halomicrobium salinisoli]|nr:hypothetical protein [Halomicrobium salinisoli]